MTSALEITDSLDGSLSSADSTRRVSSSLTKRPHLRRVASNINGPLSKPLKAFATEDIKILLLENVNQTGRKALEDQGYQVTFLKSSLAEDELIEKIRWGNAIDSSRSIFCKLMYEAMYMSLVYAQRQD